MSISVVVRITLPVGINYVKLTEGRPVRPSRLGQDSRERERDGGRGRGETERGGAGARKSDAKTVRR